MVIVSRRFRCLPEILQQTSEKILSIFVSAAGYVRLLDPGAEVVEVMCLGWISEGRRGKLQGGEGKLCVSI